MNLDAFFWVKLEAKPTNILTLILLCASLFFLPGCQPNNTPSATPVDMQANHETVLNMLKSSDAAVPPRPNVYPVHTVYNREAIIPPMCYTKTEGQYNPCYVCHQNALPERENVMNDKDLQVAYTFSEQGTKNHWDNLFEDRSVQTAKISDQEILNWVRADNYSELAGRLEEEGFRGFIPDLKNLEKGPAAFDEEGFAKDGSHWVAFNYKPFPSTFWPTNGSTDDVMIRLPEAFRTTLQGEFSVHVYRANLAILEANMKGMQHISTYPIDERIVGKDLDANGALEVIQEITVFDTYVGAADKQFKESFIYPQGTEFLHTVRYLDVNKEGSVGISTRMKEVRYMKKWQAYPKFVLAQYYLEEEFEKEAGHLPGYTFLGDNGLDNGMGWSIQGFIENKRGQLRVSSFEENLFCMGCHNSIGSTIDKTFSFARKVDGAEGWGYINLKGMPDAPNKGESKGEIATYLGRVGGGGEFRSNPEMYERWFENGQVDLEKVSRKDVYELIVPSQERALALNKAYKLIVEQQDFLFGRDATLTPPSNVYKEVDQAKAPVLKPEFHYDWDIRLDWAQNKGSIGAR